MFTDNVLFLERISCEEFGANISNNNTIRQEIFIFSFLLGWGHILGLGNIFFEERTCSRPINTLLPPK